ncbi:MAG: hypothetical protein WD294_06160 [Phycisphaeraceae bacterium]
MTHPTRQQLMAQLAVLRTRLAKYQIRGASDYAEVLIAESVGGERAASGVNQGFDVTSQDFGRIEVKCRRLPADGRREERVDLRETKADGFDSLAIVIFFPDFNVKGAVLVPYAEVWPVVAARPYRRISYPEACRLSGAIDITMRVVEAAGR